MFKEKTNNKTLQSTILILTLSCKATAPIDNNAKTENNANIVRDACEVETNPGK